MQMSKDKLLMLIRAAQSDCVSASGLNEQVSNFKVKLITFVDLQTTSEQFFSSMTTGLKICRDTVKRIALESPIKTGSMSLCLDVDGRGSENKPVWVKSKKFKNFHLFYYT